MKTIFVLLLFFLTIGVFARSYNRSTRLILSAGIIVMLLYLYIV